MDEKASTVYIALACVQNSEGSQDRQSERVLCNSATVMQFGFQGPRFAYVDALYCLYACSSGVLLRVQEMFKAKTFPLLMQKLT
jgi:hypothetical protein